MAEHLYATPSLLPYDIVARFPIGFFLENIAVRSDGTLLVSNMTSGEIFYIDSKDKNLQSTVQVIHDFNTTLEVPQEEVGGHGAYGSKYQAEAIVEHPDIADIFYTVSGLHGKAGTWAVYGLDLRQFDSVHTSAIIKIEKLIDVPQAI